MKTNIPSVIDIINKYSIEAPVNILAIAKELDIKLEPVDLGSQIAGSITKNSDSKYIIRYNTRDNEYRQRFTIAHELAHFLLHKASIGDGIQESPLYRSGLSSTMEKQANRLAANILMPRSLVDKLMAEESNNIDIVANRLNVSKKALEILLDK